jgi:hypothetical protein
MSCCVVLCRTMQGQKNVQEDKKNKGRTDLQGGYLGSRLVSWWKSCKPSATELDLAVTTDFRSVLPLCSKQQKSSCRSLSQAVHQYTSTGPKKSSRRFLLQAVHQYWLSPWELFFLSAPGLMMLPKHKFWVSNFTRFGCVTHTSVHYRLQNLYNGHNFVRHTPKG